MWKEGAMVCRARSGDAPPLGAHLNAETGISGACLRTGEMQHCADTECDSVVDVEVCRSLGLRSLAVLPIQGWRGINGILEVFSANPDAFSQQHIAFLEQMAALAERARASQPHGASAAVPKIAAETPQPSGLLPASDRVGDVAMAMVSPRSRPLAWGFAVLVAALFAAAIWLGWRGPDWAQNKAHAAEKAPTSGETVNAQTITSVTAHAPDNDPVWNANPGGQSLLPQGAKPSAGFPVTLASRVEALSGQLTPPDRRLERSTDPSRADRPLLATEAAEGTSLRLPIRAGVENQPAESAPAEPPSLATAANPSPLTGVLSAKASLPGFSAPVSQGISGGQLLRRTSPIYPAQARQLRLEGSVILDATVAEDGTVADVKVVQGPAVLARSAVEAVKQWRYTPYELDGKPVKNETTIKIDFKLP